MPRGAPRPATIYLSDESCSQAHGPHAKLIPMATVFFSYSHADEDLRNELEKNLAMLKREGVIQAWHDRKILAGDEFDSAIDNNLIAADVVLLLISPDFLASRYCYDIEVRRAMERHDRGECRVIPVILRPCDWKTSAFAKLLVIPTDGKPVTRWPDRDEAFLDVVQHIRAAIPKAPPSPAPTLAPALRPEPAIGPRSSNLRLRKQFTDADRDRFLDEAFDFIARFFENSLAELQQRNAGIEGRFKPIDSRSFGAVIYRNGKAISRCGIRRGGTVGLDNRIGFSFDDSAPANSFNESMTLGVGEQSLFLKPMGMTMMSGTPAGSHLSAEGAAEYYWSLLIGPLQR